MEIKFKIDKGYLRYLYCLVILLLPLSVINITSFYSVSSPSEIWYKYKSFNFSVLIIPFIIYAMCIRKKSYAIRFDIIIVAIAIKDIIFSFINGQNSLITFDFSLYLIMISAWALTVVVMKKVKNTNSVPGVAFFEAYFWVAFLTILVRLALGMTTDGRYGAIGLSVGGTGFFAGVYILYLIYVRPFTKNTPVFLILSFLVLVLSGQRTNLLFCIVFCALYAIRQFFLINNADATTNNKSLLLWGLLCVGIIFIIGLFLINEMGIHITDINYITRMFDAVEKFLGGSLNSEDSVRGRLNSIDAGLQILKENPLGILNVFYDLQYRMTIFNYPTFPHCTLLACALLWSTPITIICEIWLISLLIKLSRMKSDMFWVILYMQVLLLFWGGPFLDFPMLFIVLLLLSMAQYIVSQDTALV